MPELLLFAAIGLVVLTIVAAFAAMVWLFFTPDREDGFTDEEPTLDVQNHSGDSRATSRFIMTVFPEGGVILSTEQLLSPEEAEQVVTAFEQWKATPEAVAVIAECSVEHAKSVQIDLPIGRLQRMAAGYFG